MNTFDYMRILNYFHFSKSLQATTAASWSLMIKLLYAFSKKLLTTVWAI